MGPPVWGARTSSTALLAAWGARRLGSVLGAPLSLSLSFTSLPLLFSSFLSNPPLSSGHPVSE